MCTPLPAAPAAAAALHRHSPLAFRPPLSTTPPSFVRRPCVRARANATNTRAEEERRAGCFGRSLHARRQRARRSSLASSARQLFSLLSLLLSSLGTAGWCCSQATQQQPGCHCWSLARPAARPRPPSPLVLPPAAHECRQLTLCRALQAAGRCSPSPRRTAHPLTATATAPPPLAAAARSPAMQAGKIAVRVLSASGFRASPAASEQQQQQQQQLAPEAPVYLVCEVRRGAVRTMHCRHSFCSSPALLNPPIISRHRPASPRAAAGLRPPGDGAAQQGRGARQTHSV